MKSLNAISRLTRIAVAIAGIGIAATALGQIVVNQPNLSGTPDDGMVCRQGYTAVFSNNNFKCSKAQTLVVVLECTNPLFPNYVIRAPNGAASDGKDLCTKNGVVITSVGSLGSLKEGKDFVKAAVNPTTITDRTNNKDHQEALALGLADRDVDTVAGATVIFVDRGTGSKDNADLPLTHFTFAVAKGGLLPQATLAR